MSNSTRYFQLTSDILIEYNYTTTDVITKDAQAGDCSDVLIDLNDENLNSGNESITVLKNDYDNSVYFYVTDIHNPVNAESKSYKDGIKSIYADRRNFVTPINKSLTKFVKYNREYRSSYIKYGNSSIKLKPYMREGESDNGIININEDCDIIFDKIRFHFTSRNFMGNYDGIIIQAYVYNNYKRKIELLSFTINRFDNLCLNAEPMLINQKLYTLYIDAKIVSTEGLLYKMDKKNEYNPLLDYITDRNSSERLLKNSPIVFELFGINSSFDIVSHEAYNCEKISTVTVPSKDSFDGVSVDINEADDGDYFIIKPDVQNTGYEYFSDFINSLTEDPETYIILHELSLTEYYLDASNNPRQEVTHREHYMINAGVYDGNENDEQESSISKINDELDKNFLYRPICKHSDTCVKFTITDVLKIIDTYNNTTIVKKSTCDCSHPYRYGKKLNQIYLGEVPAQINVYNKRSNLRDEDIETINFSTNPNLITVRREGSDSNGGINIQTSSIGITAFCETTKIRLMVTDLLK